MQFFRGCRKGALSINGIKDLQRFRESFVIRIF
jgi:hypothetical protein